MKTYKLTKHIQAVHWDGQTLDTILPLFQGRELVVHWTRAVEDRTVTFLVDGYHKHLTAGDWLIMGDKLDVAKHVVDEGCATATSLGTLVEL